MLLSSHAIVNWNRALKIRTAISDIKKVCSVRLEKLSLTSTPWCLIVQILEEAGVTVHREHVKILQSAVAVWSTLQPECKSKFCYLRAKIGIAILVAYETPERGIAAVQTATQQPLYACPAVSANGSAYHIMKLHRISIAPSIITLCAPWLGGSAATDVDTTTVKFRQHVPASHECSSLQRHGPCSSEE